jgi:hypothetical protein
MATTKILLRRDSSSAWSTNNTVLSIGEIGYDTVLKKFKIGDGSTPWNSLGFAAIPESRIGAAGGIAPLDGEAKIPAQYLPSYVDDVVEYANLASFPAVGETGKIYVDLDTNKTYRWSGTVYIEISASAPAATFESITGLTVSQDQDGFLLGVIDNILGWIDPANLTTGGSGSSSIIISSTLPDPLSVNPGDLWWNSTNGDLFLRYDDGDPLDPSEENGVRVQWVGINKDLARIASGEFPPTNAVDGNLWWNSFNGRLYVYHNDGDSGQWIDINNPPTLNRSVNLPTTGWTGAGPFTRTITVNGIVSTDTPIIDLNTKNILFANLEAAQEFWANVYLADTGNNQITFYAIEAPGITFNLPLLIKVVK